MPESTPLERIPTKHEVFLNKLQRFHTLVENGKINDSIEFNLKYTSTQIPPDVNAGITTKSFIAVDRNTGLYFELNRKSKKQRKKGEEFTIVINTPNNETWVSPNIDGESIDIKGIYIQIFEDKTKFYGAEKTIRRSKKIDIKRFHELPLHDEFAHTRSMYQIVASLLLWDSLLK